MSEQLSLFGQPEELSCGAAREKKELDTLPEAPGRARKWPKNLGMTYVGSKSRILRGFWHLLPAADVFVDIFAGRCSVTHAAMLDHRWQHVLSNDLARTPEAFIFAVDGGARKLADRWISREDFQLLLARSDPAATLLRLAFSFSCDGVSYRYCRLTERWKKKLHYAVTTHDFRQRWVAMRRFFDDDLSGISILRLENLNFFNRCMEIEKSRAFGKKVQPSALDYRELALPAESIIYADPPYRGKQKYHAIGTFDSDSFWAWARACERPVFISEYEAPPDFACIWSAMYRTKQASNGHARLVTERLFANAAAAEALRCSK